jgi:hydroxypyruvate isomerase
MVLINTPAGEKARGEQSGLACIPDRREAFRDDVRKSLDYAAGLTASWCTCRLESCRATSAAIVWATYLTNVVWAAELASAAGICLALEPINQIDIPGFILRTQEEGLRSWKRSAVTRSACNSTSITARWSRAA